MCLQLSMSAVMMGILAGTAAAADLIAPGAEVEKLAGGFAFTEGPACDGQGNLYFTVIPNEKIPKWSVDGSLSTFRENSGRANGLYFDRQGHLVVCDGTASTHPGSDRFPARLQNEDTSSRVTSSAVNARLRACGRVRCAPQCALKALFEGAVPP